MERKSIREVFEEHDRVFVCAPMVRYSKYAFRRLVARYNTHIVYTPMMVADPFIASEHARHSEFTTGPGDTPLVAQFAANNPNSFADAAEIVAPYVDAVALNCGCPQRWAMQEGFGSSMIDKPGLMSDMIRTTVSRLNNSVPVEIKIRIHDDLRRTVDLVKAIEAAGATWLTIHGRTPKERTQPVNYEAISILRESVSLPVIANGDIFSLDDANRVIDQTGVKGVMAARGILANPALFAGQATTTPQVVNDWIRISLETGTPFQCFHQHLIFMLENVLSKPDRMEFNSLTTSGAVIDYLYDHHLIEK